MSVFIASNSTDRRWEYVKRSLKKVLTTLAKSNYFTGLTTFLTVYVLFGNDIRLLGTSKSADPIFDFCTLICLLVFSLEIVVQSFANIGYYLGFFFFLDTGASFSLILDLTFVEEALFGGGITGERSDDVARAGRMSRVSTKAGRILRILRIIRLIRMVRVYKAFLDFQKRRMTGEEIPDTDDSIDSVSVVHQESRVGKKLSESTTKKLILIVLVLLFTLPLFTPSDTNPASADFLIDRMQQYLNGFLRTSKIITDDNNYNYSNKEINVTSGNSDLAISQISEMPYNKYPSFDYLPIATLSDLSGATHWDIFVHHTLDFIMKSVKKCDTQNNIFDNPLTDHVSSSRLSINGIIETDTDYSFFSEFLLLPSLVMKGDPCTDDLSRLMFIGYLIDNKNGNTEFQTIDSWENVCSFVNQITWPFISETTRTLLSILCLPIRCPSAVGFHSLGLSKDKRETLLSNLLVKQKHGVHDISIVLSDDVLCPDNLRYNEITTLVSSIVDNDVDKRLVFYFDSRDRSYWSSILSIWQTLFIASVLFFGAITFSNDANKLILRPIESMIAKVRDIRRCPMEAVKMASLPDTSETPSGKHKIDGTWNSKDVNLKGKNNKNNITAKQKIVNETLETVLVERTIIRIGALLALGFGEAGAGIIGQNIDTEQGRLQVMIPGKRVNAVFSFCKIKHFTEITEVLGDRVMGLVNQVAELLHSITNDYGGLPNSFTGDGFMIIWRPPPMESEESERVNGDNSEILNGCIIKEHGNKIISTTNYTSRVGDGYKSTVIPTAITHNTKYDIEMNHEVHVCENAMISLTKFISALHRSPVLGEYRNHPSLQKKIPGFRVDVCISIHFGSAIEGAIGSEFKIDASYVSPTVSLAESIVNLAMKEYKMPIVFSEVVYGFLGSHLKEYCRKIDFVSFYSKGGKGLGLYTLDISWSNLEIAQSPIKIRSCEHVSRSNPFEYHEDLLLILPSFNSIQQFRDLFHMAVCNYIAGEWDVAYHALRKTVIMRDSIDGPSDSLINFIESNMVETNINIYTESGVEEDGEKYYGLSDTLNTETSRDKERVRRGTREGGVVIKAPIWWKGCRSLTGNKNT